MKLLAGADLLFIIHLFICWSCSWSYFTIRNGIEINVIDFQKLLWIIYIRETTEEPRGPEWVTCNPDVSVKACPLRTLPPQWVQTSSAISEQLPLWGLISNEVQKAYCPVNRDFLTLSFVFCSFPLLLSLSLIANQLRSCIFQEFPEVERHLYLQGEIKPQNFANN